MDDEGRPLVIGHRGASGYRPEHSREAYSLALRLGAHAVEPDLVATRDGVVVIRHENEIGATTDVADRPEFARRRTQKLIDGVRYTGWFVEDFTWDELATLRTRERMPRLRPNSASFDGEQPILRLRDLIAALQAHDGTTSAAHVLVAELKHPSYHASIGIDLVGLVHAELAAWSGRSRLVVECFEQSALTQLRERGLEARYVCLVEARADQGQLSPRGLHRLSREVDAVSVDKSMLLEDDGRGGVRAGHLVDRIHDAGLGAFAWTLRPENRFLHPAHRVGKPPRAWGQWRREYELVLSTRVDGVFADHPDLVLSALGIP